MATPTPATGNGTIDKRLDALRSDFGSLQSDVTGLASDAGVIANKRVGKAIHSAEDVAKRAINLAEEATSQAIGKVEHWADDNIDGVRKSIRNQPFYAIGLSVGLGAFIGAILARRRVEPQDG
jgi:ElaB/YqjD/DUF883 family membrane-anchored ribosome-binding protein